MTTGSSKILPSPIQLCGTGRYLLHQCESALGQASFVEIQRSPPFVPILHQPTSLLKESLLTKKCPTSAVVLKQRKRWKMKLPFFAHGKDLMRAIAKAKADATTLVV